MENGKGFHSIIYHAPNTLETSAGTDYFWKLNTFLNHSSGKETST